MVQIPDSIRPAVAILAKYHFWMLAALVPLIMLPLVFMANSQLEAQMQAARSQIDSRFSALRSVESQNPHPNEAWSQVIVDNTKRTKLDTLAAWSAFWQSQEPLRVWPKPLGEDFLQRAATLKPGGTLPRKLLERYQNGVRQLVRELPARMGAEEHMRDEGGDGPEPPVIERRGARSPRALVEWSPEDQKKLYQSFNWEKAPSTTQVVMAQEELWVYGLLCDAIARINRSAAGAYNAPITAVSALAIGYPATEDTPSGGSRIMVPKTAAMAGGEAMPMDMPLGEAGLGGQPMGRPPHPRFGGGMGGGMGGGEFGGLPIAAAPDAGGGEGGATVASPDDALKNWVYVDFDGKPLMAADLQANPAAQMVHLLPFVIRLQMDQRSLDALLVDLAASPIPIDVRQVRINPGSGSGSMGFEERPGRQMPQPAAGELGGPAGDRARLHDIDVELRGTIAMATPPNPKIIGIEEADLQTAGEDEETPAAEDAEAEATDAQDAAEPDQQPGNEPPPAAPPADDEAPVAVQPAEAAP